MILKSVIVKLGHPIQQLLSIICRLTIANTFCLRLLLDYNGLEYKAGPFSRKSNIFHMHNVSCNFILAQGKIQHQNFVDFC